MLRSAARCAVAAAFAALVVLAGCDDPGRDIDQAVLAPREGRVLSKSATQPDTGVAIVYSLREDMRLKMGWEQFTNTAPHKGRDIYRRLVDDGAIRPDDVFVPADGDDESLAAVHRKSYLDSLDDRAVVSQIFDSQAVMWQSPADSRERIVGSARAGVGGTMRAAELAAAHGIAIHLGGGFTHAFADRGGRGHLLADIPVAIKMLRQRKLAQKIMVVKLGALQANGLASCLADDKETYLLDVYERDNYPPTKHPEAGGVAIPPGLGDSEYRQKVDDALTRAVRDFQPDFVFYVAGVDVVAGDPVGRTAMTASGIVSRDLFVVNMIHGKHIPICIVLGEGGAADSWQLTYRSIRGLLAIYGGVPFRREN